MSVATFNKKLFNYSADTFALFVSGGGALKRKEKERKKEKVISK